MDVKFPDVTVKMVGQDGSAFAILGRVQSALKKAGHGDAVNEFMDEATAGDYDHLLRTVLAWVTVDDIMADDEYDDDSDERCPNCGRSPYNERQGCDCD